MTQERVYLKRQTFAYSVWDAETDIFLGYADEPGHWKYDRDGNVIPQPRNPHEELRLARKDSKQKTIRTENTS